MSSDYLTIESILNFVRMEGLEPPYREVLDPKSSASTNFATSALLYFWSASL